MQHKNIKLGRLALTPKRLLRSLDILHQLAHSIFQRSPRIIDLIDNQDILANQIGHFQRTQIQPLRAGDFGPRDFLGIAAAEVFIERQADGLDGDVGFAGAFEE